MGEGRGAGFDGQDDLVDRVYDIAIAPERLEDLIDRWTLRLRDHACAPEQPLAEPHMIRHVQRAERVLREMIAIRGEARDSAREWAQACRSAAVVVDRTGQVLAANTAARRTLGLVAASTLDALPAIAEDRQLMADLIANIDTASDSHVRLLRLRKTGEGAPILVRVVEHIGGDPEHFGLITSILSWPEHLAAHLTATFQLTRAECDVLQRLTLGNSVKEIAQNSNRSEATVRSHVKSLLEKTGLHTQMELVRVTLGLLDVSAPKVITPLGGPHEASPQPTHYRTLVLADGRNLDYLVIGDERGRAFVMLPSDLGFTRLPPAAEAWLAQHGLRMVVPVRAGYGHSSPLPRHRDAMQVGVEDVAALSWHLGIRRCPLLAFCEDFHFAISYACAMPQRVTAIIAVGPLMPATEPRHFQRMTKWSRFLHANARYAPLALQFVAMAFFQYARRLGARRFMQTMVASSRADLKAIEDDELLSALVRGAEIAIGPHFTAHAAWAAGVAANLGVDWSGKLAACPVPMIVFAGSQDPFAPIETTREFAATSSRLTLHELPDHGQFLYSVWPRFLEEVLRHLAK